MEQLNYQAQQFENIVPVLDVGDPSASLSESYRTSLTDQNSILTQMTKDASVEAANVKKNIEGLEALAKFSQSAVKEVTAMKNQQVKREASEIWAENFNNFEAPSEEELNFVKQEEQAAKVDTDVQVAVSKNIEKKGKAGTLTTQDTADAAKVRKATGWRAVVAANARAEAAADSYGPALEAYIRKVAENRPASDPLEPGADLERVKQDFNRRWADATGMSMANAGYTAKHVYPRLRREAAAATEQFTRNWTRQQDAEESERSVQALVDGQLTAEQFFALQRGLTNGDGKTLKTNADAYAVLARAELSTDQLDKIGDQDNKVTGKKYSEHPRFQALRTASVRRQRAEYNEGIAMQAQLAREAFNGATTREEAIAIRDRLRAQGGDLNVIQQAYDRALDRTVRADKIESEKNRITDLLSRKGPDYKLTAADLAGAPYEVWSQFEGRRAEDANSELMISRIKESERFKEIKKDMPGLIGLVDKNIKLQDLAAGIPGPPNQKSFELTAMNEIAVSAQNFMLDGMSMDEAIKEARDQWVKRNREAAAKGEFYNPGTGFVQDAISADSQAAVSVRAKIKQLNNTTLTNLPEGMNESDYTPDANGRFSESVQYLSRQLGVSPSEIVTRARLQAGMPPLEPTSTDVATSQMSKGDSARIASLGSATPIQTAIRAQINSGQVLQGDAKQRTIAVGQQILAMGYGGVWQHPKFNYDTGYDPNGNHEYYRQGYNSAHNHEEALDIGLAANGPERLEQLYQYLLKNKKRFGIRNLWYAPKGSGRPDPDGSHWHHVHVDFDHEIGERL